ncbi:MAG: penicillin acylase family protein [Candidatus Aminicenantes bacterium]|jgi:penicillin amidase
MKAVKITVRVLVVLLACVLIMGVLFIRSVARRGLPDYNETVELRGLSDEVTVYRDSYGIPHVYAQNEGDLYRAVGYCMAQDRLWQMDLIRRGCSGGLSEIFGEDLVDTDLLMLSLRIPDKSRMVLERSEENIVGVLEAFAEGVNLYITAFQKKLPPEFIILGYKPEPWKAEHSLYLISYMAWDLTESWREEILVDRIRRKFGEEMAAKFLPDWEDPETAVYHDFYAELDELPLKASLLRGNRHLRSLGLSVFSGSNNWAVSGERSATGKPILANDAHLGLNSPGIWYQMHQVIEGKLNVTGVVLPGQPAVIIGHNDCIAWGFTNVMVDNLDFYLERINPENPHQYELNGEWKDMEVRKIAIKVKGGRVVEEELRFTHRGPIISRFHGIEDLAVSMRWAGNDFSNELRSVFLVNRAKNWEYFKEAMKTFKAASQNVVYADIEGNIGLYCCAGVPIRKGGETNLIFPGWTDEYDWKGYVPFEDLPHSFNPKSGFVSSANNKTVGGDFPFYISRWFDLSYRIDRIREMLTEQERFSVEDFKRMQADQRSKLVEHVKDTIVSGVRRSNALTEIEKQSLEMLSLWEGKMSATSPEASLFETFLNVFLKNIFWDDLGDELYLEFISCGSIYKNALHRLFEQKESLWCDDRSTEGIRETFADILLKSFKDTVAVLEEEIGKDPRAWQWGKIHKLSLHHPMGSVKILDSLFKFNRGPYEVGGSYHTVCPYSYPFRDPFNTETGASKRLIYSVADWDKSMTVIPTGTSGIPASPHYCDQAELYVNNLYHTDFVSRDKVASDAKYKMVLKRKSTKIP